MNNFSQAPRGWSKRKIITGAILCFVLILCLFNIGKVFEDVDAGEVVVIQNPTNGKLSVYKTPGLKWQLWGKATHYKKSNQFWFTIEKDGNDTIENKSIPVKWNDGGTAIISGSVRYDLPLSDEKIIQLHSTFGSQEAIERDLIKTNIEKAIAMTGPLMTSKESYAEKKNDLIYYIEDQASKGVYKTRVVNIRVIDELDSTEKNIAKVEILNDSKGQPYRQEVSPITAYGVRLYNISIKDMHYDGAVEKQIKTQQESYMSVQTAIANAKKAEQDAITIAKQGEANAAAAKWEIEVQKAKVITQAEADKAVAELAVKTAELNKQKLILEGEGEAAKKRLVMQANGALEQKLDAWLRAQDMWSSAFSNYKGQIVPSIIMGGNGSASTNAAQNFMDMMMMKNAKELSLDMSTRKD